MDLVAAPHCSTCLSAHIALESTEESTDVCWKKSSEGYLFYCLNHVFLGSSLKVNPEERLSITELVNQLQEIAAARNVNPKSPITEVKESHKGVLLIRFPSFLSFFLSNVSLVTNVRAGPMFLSLLKTSQFCNSFELIYITCMVFENVLL